MSIGFHVSKRLNNKNVSLDEALTARSNWLSREYGVDNPIHQIFIGPPKKLQISITDNDIQAIRDKHKVIIHGSYLTGGIWNKCCSATLNNIRESLRISQRINGKGVIIHANENANVMELLNKLPEAKKTRLWLEIPATKPSERGLDKPANIKRLFQGIPSDYKLGFCIDTAHLYALGTSLKKYNETLNWIKEVKKVIPNNIKWCWHLNDSSAKQGSGLDRHIGLAKGNIWKGVSFHDSGVQAIMEYAVGNNEMVILERAPRYHESDMEYIFNN